ncbi:hypothetical protein NXW97_24400 [Bacteroides faecis]|uniref:Uncharacterized protein n=1 Tax=Bacteroides faecis TaxID=674529 RepID=A0AAW5P330_9BACE|nr:hypothetical protein [Bacteroides faecis]MCS2795091.1 hypothetical protein [Bacteroides faecis]
MACFIAMPISMWGFNLAMDDGVSDLIKYSWFNVAERQCEQTFYYDNMSES